MVALKQAPRRQHHQRPFRRPTNEQDRMLKMSPGEPSIRQLLRSEYPSPQDLQLVSGRMSRRFHTRRVDGEMWLQMLKVQA